MKNKKILWTIRIILSLLTVTCAVTIFCFSAQTVTESKQTSDAVVDRVIENQHPDYASLPKSEQISISYYTEINIRTYAHMLIYCALGGLLFFFLFCFNINVLLSSVITLAIAFIYALSDEWHQTFVEGRTGSMSDVAKDTVGIICGIAICALVYMALTYITHKKLKSVSEQ